MSSNPALAPLARLIGTWTTVGTHPYVPNTTFHGRTTFAWIEEGAFIVMRSEIDEPEIPTGVAVFGSDDSTGELFMLYVDERTVSRKYDVSFADPILRWWRNTAEFSQRFVVTLAADGQTMVGRGEMSRDSGPWEQDLELTYTRVR